MTRLFAGTPFDIPPQCDLCGKPETDCVCTDQQKAEVEAKRQRDADRQEPSQQTARVSVQKRKGGRQATVVEGLTSKANDLPELLTRLQAGCGAGGTVKAKEDLIELQGDHRDKVMQTLRDIGYKTK
ncbi:translation initiation factor Sui1 [Rubripirellula lacrimiformis]|uniref:Translation initiation factor Sui1 n=1 Tax=Rubripirellula lacrimiformis TaxID=1930273 RepID=A0A517NGP6_9BACT|nr:translation initiation factor [Rubripirellula lacrimiformis]QDT06301.1 translation initiation factor Sui1 [Rubripirellula lacrimiformis]